MARKSAPVGHGLPVDGRIWDEDFAPAELPEFDFPRRRITGSSDRTNGNGRANGTGRANGNAYAAVPAANGHRAPAANGDRTPVTTSERASETRRPVPSSGPGQGVPGRRTVTIRGYGAERNLPWTAGQSRRRPAQPRHQRPGFRADRAAMWAVLLGIMLVVVAAASSHAAMLRAVAARSPARATAHVAIAAPRFSHAFSPRANR